MVKTIIKETTEKFEEGKLVERIFREENFDDDTDYLYAKPEKDVDNAGVCQDVYVDVFNDGRCIIYVNGMQILFKPDQKDLIPKIISMMQRGQKTQVYVDRRGYGILICDLLDKNGIEYKVLQTQSIR